MNDKFATLLNISVHNFMDFKQFLMCFDDTKKNIFKQ